MMKLPSINVKKPENGQYTATIAPNYYQNVKGISVCFGRAEFVPTTPINSVENEIKDKPPKEIQSSQQINAIVMGLAGASRLFDILDEPCEQDDGYVTLVRCNIDENGTITETEERTGHWAWKHPHSADGSVTYKILEGDVVLDNVDFGYTDEKMVLIIRIVLKKIIIN